MDQQTLKMELIYSLPTQRILEVTSNLAVEHPQTKEIIFLKQRKEDTPLTDFILYNKPQDMNHDYPELFKKSVIIDPSLLGMRGRKALGIF